MSDEPERPMAVRVAVIAAAAPRKGIATFLAKQVARTRMAPRSSTVASVRRKAVAAGGIFVRKKPSTPSAKAMSVAIGTAIAPIEPPGITSCAIA